MRVIAPATPLVVPGPIAQPGVRARPLALKLGDVTLGHHHVSLSLQGHTGSPVLNVRWPKGCIEVRASQLEELLADIRALYYDALRGRRSRSLAVGDYPVVTVGIHNEGAQLYCALQQEIDGEIASLSFPAREVPAFLDVAGAALSGK